MYLVKVYKFKCLKNNNNKKTKWLTKTKQTKIVWYYSGEHFALYMKIKSLCYIPKTIMILC